MAKTPAAAPDPGGELYENVGSVALTIPHPPAVVAPGDLVRLPYVPTHRSLKPAVHTDLAAPAPDTTTGQES